MSKKIQEKQKNIKMISTIDLIISQNYRKQKYKNDFNNRFNYFIKSGMWSRETFCATPSAQNFHGVGLRLPTP